jgi:hypothetical protein
MTGVVEEVARKLGGQSVLGRDVRSQADLALAVRRRLPLVALKGLVQAGITATSPALCVLEKLVHIEDPELLPPLVMVRYDVPDDLCMEAISIGELPDSWRLQESWTQQRGDQWHAALDAPLLRAPSTFVPLDGSPDMNVLINHRHPAAGRITIIATETFALNVRLF